MQNWSTSRCYNHRLVLNIKKTNKIIVDFLKQSTNIHSTIDVGTKLLRGTQNSSSLVLLWRRTWPEVLTSFQPPVKAQQCLFFSRKMKLAKIHQQHIINFYNCAVGSVFSLKCVHTAGGKNSWHLPEIRSICASRCLRRLKNIFWDRYVPVHDLFYTLRQKVVHKHGW